MIKRLTPRSSSQVVGFVVEMNVKVFFLRMKLGGKLIFQDLTRASATSQTRLVNVQASFVVPT